MCVILYTAFFQMVEIKKHDDSNSTPKIEPIDVVVEDASEMLE